MNCHRGFPQPGLTTRFPEEHTNMIETTGLSTVAGTSNVPRNPRPGRGLRWRCARVTVLAVAVATLAGGVSFLTADAPRPARNEAGIRWRIAVQHAHEAAIS